MANRNALVLAQLASGPVSSSSIAHMLDCPEPSVRRSIQELRRQGHNISFAGNDGTYRMGV